MTIREFYTLVGGSYDDMSDRFPSDALILRFLTMLPQDGSMELLARSMDTADAKTAFRAVHTLKGVALNLGLTALAGVCSEMTEALRGSDTLPAPLTREEEQQLMAQLNAEGEQGTARDRLIEHN